MESKALSNILRRLPDKIEPSQPEQMNGPMDPIMAGLDQRDLLKFQEKG